MAALTLDEIKQLVADNNQADDIADAVFICQIWKESGFDPAAKNAHSSATGLMQMTKGAVTEVNRVRGTTFAHADMTDAATNIKAGTTYVDLLKKRNHGDLTKGLDKFGTGKGYSTGIIACSDCLASDANHPLVCLQKIHR